MLDFIHCYCTGFLARPHAMLPMPLRQWCSPALLCCLCPLQATAPTAPVPNLSLAGLHKQKSVHKQEHTYKQCTGVRSPVARVQASGCRLLLGCLPFLRCPGYCPPYSLPDCLMSARFSFPCLSYPLPFCIVVLPQLQLRVGSQPLGTPRLELSPQVNGCT